MTKPKIIAVIGATGAQGGGLIRAIRNDRSGSFEARAITRNTGSPAARALGVPMVRADLDDEATLVRAFRGVHGVFGVTNFWEHMSPERETRQALALANAAAVAGVQHFIWSTLEDTRLRVPPGSGRMPLLMGKYNVPHTDAKGEADAYFTAMGVPTTALRTSFYWDNLIRPGMLARGVDGRLVLPIPMGQKKLPGIASGDIGACALAIFKQGERHIGRTLGVAGQHLTGDEMAESLTYALGQPVSYQAVPLEAYRSLGFPGADDVANMFQFKQDFEAEFCAARPVQECRSLYPDLLDFDEWLARNAGAIAVP